MKSSILKEAEKRLKQIYMGCGVKIGIPLFKKFRPCGYNNREYFCERCWGLAKYQKWLISWLEAQEREFNKEIRKIKRGIKK